MPGDTIDLQNLFLEESDHDVQALTRMTVGGGRRSPRCAERRGLPKIGHGLVDRGAGRGVDPPRMAAQRRSPQRQDAARASALRILRPAASHRAQRRGRQLRIADDAGTAGRCARADPGAMSTACCNALETDGLIARQQAADRRRRLVRAARRRRIQRTLSPPDPDAQLRTPRPPSRTDYLDFSAGRAHLTGHRGVCSVIGPVPGPGSASVVSNGLPYSRGVSTLPRHLVRPDDARARHHLRYYSMSFSTSRPRRAARPRARSQGLYRRPPRSSATAIPIAARRPRPARHRADRHRQDRRVRAAVDPAPGRSASKRVLPTHCRMLVLAPTRELASQIADSARGYGQFSQDVGRDRVRRHQHQQEPPGPEPRRRHPRRHAGPPDRPGRAGLRATCR